MALIVRNAGKLKPEIRLAQAISEFEANLNAQHKTAFRNARDVARKTPPTPSDVMRLTAEIDSRVRQEHGPSRCFGPRLTNILQAVQQFAALGDTVVGGSQNIVACGVWSAVRIMLHMAIGYASYLEKLSLVFMTAGRQAPRYQALAIIYPQSKDLQNNLSEYFIVIVQICQKIQQYGTKSSFGQFKSSLNDADLKGYQADLEGWGNSIKDEAMLLLNQRLQNESEENEKARALVSKWSTSSTQRQQALERAERIQRRVRWLEACSRYDFQTTWKQLRKRGSTSLLPTWPEYQQWKQKVETPSAILFGGKLGAGKSVTLANIIDDLHLSGDAIIVYFFCRHDIPKSLTTRTILGSLARQYLSHFQENNEAFKEDVQTLDIEELTALMQPTRDERQRYLLIDGLDECNTEERNSFLTQICWLQKESNWRLGFSARHSAESFIGKQISLRWHVSLPTNNPDIEQYIDSELRARQANGQLKVGDQSLLIEIRAALLNGAQGMFLWVALQLDQICLEVSDYSIRVAIKSLPQDLTEMYARIISSSAARDTNRYHVRLFKFLAAAYMPLTIDQIRDMASVTIGDTDWNSSKIINDTLKVIGYCGSLVMIEEEEQTVQFVHHSARGFCQGALGGQKNWKFRFSDDEAHREIGETAVTYLSYGIFDTRLSTNVIPKVNVGGIAKRIVHRTLSTSKPMARLALSFVKPKQDRTRDIGQFLAHAQKEAHERGSDTTSYPFFSYAKKFWMLHTRHMEESAVHKLWGLLVDEVIPDGLQLTSHVHGPLDAIRIHCNYPLASAFLWAVNYSHIAMFDHLMVFGCNRSFGTKLPWARFYFFRALLQHLQPQKSCIKSLPLEPQMAQRLLPLAIILRVHHAVEAVFPCIDFQEAIRAFKMAVAYRNYETAAFISANLVSKDPKRFALPNELFEIAISSQDVQAISLLVKTVATRSSQTNASALWGVLYSGMHQAALLRCICILANAGIQMNPSNRRDIPATLQLLSLSPEMNTNMASELIQKVIMTNADFQEVYQRTFHHACAIGSFSLAYTTWLCHDKFEPAVSKISGFPFNGDELALALQTVSKSRIRLANWLFDRGAHVDDQQAFRRAILLRNWQLANALLAERDLKGEMLKFCTNHELLHICILGGDLAGIDFLLRIGMAFEDITTGPMFRHETSMFALVTQDSDYFAHLSIAELFKRGASIWEPISPRFADFKDDMDNLVLPENPSTWDSRIQHLVRQELQGGILANDYSWLVCFLAVLIRKTVRFHLIREVPLDSDVKTGKQYLQKLLALLKEILRPGLVAPTCGYREGIIAIREVFGVAADIDRSVVGEEPLSVSSRWHAEARTWQFFDFLVARQSRAPTNRLSRGTILEELASLLCRRPLEDIFSGPPSGADPLDLSDPVGIRKRVYEVLSLAERGRHLSLIVHCLVLRSRKLSVREICDLSNLNAGRIEVSNDTRQAFDLMGWTERDITMLTERRNLWWFAPPRGHT